MRLFLPSLPLLVVPLAFWLATEALIAVGMLVAIFILMHMVTRTQVWEVNVDKVIEILPDIIRWVVFIPDSRECIVLCICNTFLANHIVTSRIGLNILLERNGNERHVDKNMQAQT